jgi:hypothetical protein
MKNEKLKLEARNVCLLELTATPPIDGTSSLPDTYTSSLEFKAL